MNKETEIQRRKRNLARKTAYLYFINGIKQLMSNPLKLLIVVGYGLLAVVAWCYRDKLLFELDSNFLLYPVFTIAVDFSVAVLLLFGLLCLISVIGTPYQAKRVQDHLINAGFTNHKQQPPLLLSKYKHHRNPKVMIWEFDQNQMPLSVWNDKREQLNGALLNTVFRVEQSKNGKRIILYGNL